MIITCRKEIPGRWILLTILPWASFTLNFQVIGQAFIFSLKKFVENPVGLTFILSLPSFIAIVVAPVASFLSDRIWTRFGRRKPFVVLASACMIVAFVVMPLAANVWLLVASYILYHFGEALCAPRDPLKQEIVPPAARGQATGAMTWCQNLAQVVFFAVILGRFDDVSYFAGIPLHGETIIYWSAALLLGVMVLMITLGIKEVDQKSPLVGQRLSLRNFVGGILDRELWPVYLLTFSYYLINIYTGFGPFLSTLLYTEQWSYTKQEMGTNVAIGGIVNLVLIGLLTLFANRLPRLRSFRVLITLCLAWNAFYFCYVNFILPDRRPTLTEIFVFGEVLTILSILVGLIYTPLVYDYVRRNKMGTFAAGAQIATRATQLFTLNGVGLFVWAYATLFQPPAGEMTRVVLREDAGQAAFVASLRAAPWSSTNSTGAVADKDVSARVWQADGVAADTGRSWEIRLRNKDSEKLAAEKKTLEETRSPLLAEEKQLMEAAAVARGRHDPSAAALAGRTVHTKQAEIATLNRRLEVINAELADRAARLRAQVTALLGPRLLAEGEQLRAARLQEALVVELATTEKPGAPVIEKLLYELRRDFPALIDLRPLKRDSGYGLAASVLPEPAMDDATRVSRLQTVMGRVAARRAPGLLVVAAPLAHRYETALTLELQTVERPVPTYISPVSHAVNAVFGLFGRAPSPERRLAAVARNLRVVNETNHVRVTLGSDDRSLGITALLEPTSALSPRSADALHQRLTALLPAADDTAVRGARAFYERVEIAAATQRITVAHPVLAASYAPMRYDYMSGYIWVFFVGIIGILLTVIFGRLEAKGSVSKRGVEEAKAS